jgi:hypothetical protein
VEANTPEARGLRNACRLFLQDLEALPDEAFDRSFGPKTRTVADIVYEVNLVNDHVGMIMRGEEPFDWPEGGFIRAPEEARSKTAVVEGFRRSAERIVATAEGLRRRTARRPGPSAAGS